MAKHLFDQLKGSWEGPCRTWFQPGELADESVTRGQFSVLMEGKFLRHRYESQIQGKQRHGEELIAFNSVSGNFEIAWIDDFHTSAAILFSRGKPAENGFSVFGTYEVEQNSPPWGWKTVFEIHDNEHLTIVAYNVTPEGDEAKALETVFVRQTSA